jgi:PAS domain S-box-containing protein
MSLHTATNDSTDSHSAEIQRLMRLLELERAARAASESALAQKTETLDRIQRSELYFRHLTEYSLDFITILDADGTIRFESHSIEKDLGYHRDDYLGKNAFDFLHPDDVPRVMQSFIGALQSHGNTPLLSFRFRHKDGS